MSLFDEFRSENSQPRVLIIEDEDVLLDELASALEFTGTPVMCASNAASAVELLTQHQNLCVVLMDWRMPGLAGANLVRTIKAEFDPQRPVAIVAMSGGWTEEDEQTAVGLGVVACVRKPYSINTLKRAIRTAMAATTIERQDGSG